MAEKQDLTKLLEDSLKGYRSAVAMLKPKWQKRVDEYQLLKGKVKKKKYKSEANFNVPYAETLKANVYPLLVARLPESKVAARNHDRDKDAATLMKELVQYTFDVERFEHKFMAVVDEAMELDTGWLEVCWEYEDVNSDHPRIKLEDTFNVLVHPKKKDLDDKYPIYQRRLMTKEEMKDMGWDVGQINSMGKNFLETEEYRKQKLQTLGYDTQEDGSGEELYEVIKVWKKMDFGGEKKMGLLVIANQEKIVNLQPFKGKEQFQSPYNHNFYPLIPLPYDPSPGTILGTSFIAPVVDQQLELNALENMKADNYKRRNNPPIKYKKGTGIDLSTLRFEAGAPWGVQNMTDIDFMLVPDLAPSIDNQQQMIRRVMQDRTGANDLLLVSNDTAIKGGDTATGASIANENTKLRFRPQAIHIDFMVERVGEIIIALYQQPDLFDKEKAIAIADEEGNFAEKLIKPGDIQGELQFVVTSASSLAESNEQKLTKMVNLKNIYLEDQSINQEVFDKPIFEAAELDYTKAKKGKEEGLAELAGKLKELVALTQRPDFKEQPPQVQNRILTQISNIKEMLQGGEQPQEGVETLVGEEPGL